MKIKNVYNCQFSVWYNCFKEVTFSSSAIDLPEEVVAYFLADGLVLPEGCDQKLSKAGLEEDSDDETDWDTVEQDEAKRPKFPEFNLTMEKAIEKLGGEVFPKLNWSSPKDASWISFDGSLKCKCAGDVYLLIKGSSFCTHDLIEPYIQCEDYEEGQKYDVKYQLVLRKWQDINPAYEFRCFVKKGQLIAICQRHHSSHFPFLDSQKEAICKDIHTFFKENIRGKFPDDTVVFDVYRKQENIVYLVDFNPFGAVTDSLLFTWAELNGEDLIEELRNKEGPVFRCVEKQAGVQPNPLQQYGMPLDMLHLSTGEDPQKLIDLMNVKIQSENTDSSDGDEVGTS